MTQSTTEKHTNNEVQTLRALANKPWFARVPKYVALSGPGCYDTWRGECRDFTDHWCSIRV